MAQVKGHQRKLGGKIVQVASYSNSKQSKSYINLMMRKYGIANSVRVKQDGDKFLVFLNAKVPNAQGIPITLKLTEIPANQVNQKWRYVDLKESVAKEHALLANKSITSEVNMNTDSILDKYPLLKSKVKAHQRKTAGGKVVQVREHTDSRTKKIPKDSPHAPNGTKYYNTQAGVGSSKYSVNMHDGKQTHPDGSSFYGIKMFNNKKKFEAYIKELEKDGYKYGSALGKSTLDKYPLLKSVVKQHPRKTKTGKVTTVRQHTTKVQKKTNMHKKDFGVMTNKEKGKYATETLAKFYNVKKLLIDKYKFSNKDAQGIIDHEKEAIIVNRNSHTEIAEKVADAAWKRDTPKYQKYMERFKKQKKADKQPDEVIEKNRADQKSYDIKRSKEVAKTIYSQIGHKALYMIGAKNFVAGKGENDLGFLAFKIMRNSKGVNYIRIALNGKDLYDIQYQYMTMKTHKIKSEDKDMSFDKLHESIRRNTGLNTSLGTMGKSLDKYPLLIKVIYPDMDKAIKFQIGDDKMKTPQKPMLDSVKFPTLAKAHANLKKSMSFKIGGQKLKTAIDGKIATCKGELIVLEKEYPPVPINSEDATAKVSAVGEDAPVTKVEVKVTDHWKVRGKKRQIEELETYSRNINVKISYNLDKYELSQFGL